VNKITTKDAILLFLGVSGGFIGAGVYGLVDHYFGEVEASMDMVAFALIIFFVLWWQFKKV
jgi:ABC-type nickel/cobalt efflux system permease component RcnA